MFVPSRIKGKRKAHSQHTRYAPTNDSKLLEVSRASFYLTRFFYSSRDYFPQAEQWQSGKNTSAPLARWHLEPCNEIRTALPKAGAPLQLEFPPHYPKTSGKTKTEQGDTGQNPGLCNTTVTDDGLSFLLFSKRHPSSLPCFSFPNAVVLKHTKLILWGKNCAKRQHPRAKLKHFSQLTQMLQNILPSSIPNVDVTSSGPGIPLCWVSTGPCHMLTWIYRLIYPSDKREWECAVPNPIAYCCLAAVLYCGLLYRFAFLSFKRFKLEKNLPP